MFKREFYSNILDDYLIDKTYEFDKKNKIPKNIFRI